MGKITQLLSYPIKQNQELLWARIWSDTAIGLKWAGGVF